MSFGVNNGEIHWHGYGIESITTFINDVVALEARSKTLSDLESNRPTFKESSISTMVTELANRSLKDNSNWQSIEI